MARNKSEILKDLTYFVVGLKKLKSESDYWVKRFDCEDEPNEFMEAPCRCDCGKWFDLDDGYPDGKGNIICKDCKEGLENEEDD